MPRTCSEDDSEPARIARLLFYYANIAFFAGLLYAGMYLALNMQLTAAGAGSACIGGAIALWMLYRGGNWITIANIIVASAFIAVSTVALATGNLHSPVLGWMFAAPMMAVSTLGRKTGLVWLGITLVFLYFVYRMHEHTAGPLSEVPESFSAEYIALVQGGLIISIFTIVWSFDSVQQTTVGKLRVAKRVAEQALQDAKQTHDDALLVLNNVAEGLGMVSLEGNFVGEPSQRFQSWFGPIMHGETIWEYIGKSNSVTGDLMELNWQQLRCDWMPLEMGLDQLPNRFEAKGLVFDLKYQPVFLNNQQLSQLLVICTDISAELDAEHANELQHEQMAIFTRFVRDPKSVRGFLSESQRLVDLLENGHGSFAEQKRWIHTLKGNFGIFGLRSFAQWLHRLEDQLADQRKVCAPVQCEAIAAQWESVRDRLSMIIPDEKTDQATIDKSEIAKTIALAKSGVRIDDLVHQMERWTWDCVSQRLELLAERAQRLAERLEKPGLSVKLPSARLRTPPTEQWNAFWNSLTHVVRNAVDHGIESTDQRIKQGKTSTGTICLNAFQNEESFVIEVADDGAGIDWSKVRSMAERMLGVVEPSRSQLKDLIFADGLSTKEIVSETSGRGVGMGACKEACLRLGGQIEIDSELGQGTTVRFVFPSVVADISEPAYYI
ncbi:ATP-binding protein [Rhodopirellula sp. MGV]|uniref:ATP-binding protein n=1 Tax=Rhodopirellula sp. MGV TaxID=2023130 RepID=UPI000B970EE8|nr:ATP-binding protein [Rhodopirellula sp. MGV]OYP30429.1 hypothetical protein CGZ80_22520 [Rhodopirellula sp. MGV]